VRKQQPEPPKKHKMMTDAEADGTMYPPLKRNDDNRRRACVPIRCRSWLYTMFARRFVRKFLMVQQTSVLCLVLSLAVSTLPADEPTPAQHEFFEKKIRPVLVKECYSCHSAQGKSVKAGLLLDTREGIRRGGESGHAVVPGHPEESLLLEAVRHEGLQMPPKKQLADDIIADFETWVRMGAPDPRDGKSAPVRHSINFEQSRNFWAFREICVPVVPQSENKHWPVSDIDHFVLAKLESHSLAPSADAAPGYLIRRLYFDLIGLPPTPDQVREFVTDPSDQAFRETVDRLLNSDQFGERWGRHWLDVVRYAESTGMERNYTYPEAWRYRDYVIEAFNSDKPFDRFITEQIAGDLLTPADQQERNANQVATGMLALGPKSLNERDNEKFAMDIVDEQIDVVSRAFLGLTASCARCHDHKFDPIPQTEYYQLAGIFRSTDTFYGTGGGNGNRQSGRLLALRDDEFVPVNVSGGIKKAVRKLSGQLKAQQKRLDRAKQQKFSEKQIQQIEKAIVRIQRQLKTAREKAAPPAQPDRHLVMGVRDSAQPADTELRIRGEANERAEPVPRGFLTIATLGQAPDPAHERSGRAELARWLIQPENPLTARVAANRIWQHLFGNGIVRTVNNFGANGDRPSHPKLLDYLAGRLTADDWSVKSLIRLIVSSRTYRQASLPTAVALKADPENRWLWRMSPRRLEAEALRDAVLAVSGTLDLSPAEKSIVTEVGNGDIGRTLKTNSFAVSDTKRSVYLPIVRGVVPEMLRVFDFPEPSIIAGSRDVTTVPIQALYMMNSPFVVEQSRAMANRLLTETGNGADRIHLGYQLALGRAATSQEIERSLNFIDTAYHAGDRDKRRRPDSEQEAWAGFCQVVLASAEFRYLE